MSNVESVSRHYANVAAGDAEADRQLFSPDVVTVDPGAGRLDGLEAFLGYEQGFHQAFPDGRMEIVTTVEQGEHVLTEGVFKGTHTGPLAGPTGEIPPTGRSLELPFSDAFRFRDGRIVEHRIYYDQMTFLTQLGLVGAPA